MRTETRKKNEMENKLEAKKPVNSTVICEMLSSKNFVKLCKLLCISVK